MDNLQTYRRSGHVQWLLTANCFAPVGQFITFGWNVSRANNKKMKKSTIADGTTSARTKDEQGTEAENMHVSPTGAKPSVSGGVHDRMYYVRNCIWYIERYFDEDSHITKKEVNEAVISLMHHISVHRR